MNLSSLFSHDLILLDLPAADAASAIAALAERMAHLGYVRSTYRAAVLAREQEFPTGLPMPERAVAVPHTNAEHCLRPGIAVARLAAPVAFGEMGSTTRQVQVDLVFQLSITDPRAQVGLLQGLLAMFQRPDFFAGLLAAGSANAALSVLQRAATTVPTTQK